MLQALPFRKTIDVPGPAAKLVRLCPNGCMEPGFGNARMFHSPFTPMLSAFF
jgi:hypothetical protein